MAAEQKTKTEQKPKTEKVPGLRVSAKVAGFRRAGRAWSATPEDVPASEFTKEQIAQLKADPSLTVAAIEIEVEVEPKAE
jgi:hypothetical protein